MWLVFCPPAAPAEGKGGGEGDAEASFSVSIYIDKRIKSKEAWVVKPSFQISLNSFLRPDIKLLLQLQEFFACGSIVIKKNRSEGSFRVNSLHDLTNFIVPHFVKYPLLSQKGADFYLFKQIINLINTKVHLTAMGLQEIINIRASMNSGLLDLQKSKFTTYNPVPRPNFNFTEIPNPNWIAGFASGEGCFLCTISIAKATNNNKIGYITQLVFKISQHSRDKKVLELIANFMNCGGICAPPSQWKCFRISSN